VQALQVAQQGQQGHGILTTRDCQQQRRSRRQQLGMVPQVAMQPQVVRAPARPGWENRFTIQILRFHGCEVAS